MALVVKDRVKETTATTGTGTLTLAGAVTGFQTFTSVLSDGDTTYYGIFESATGAFEVGLGTFTSSGTTLARTTILESSNSGSAVNLGAGNKDVFITQPAEKAVYLDASGYIAAADGRNVTNVAASTAATLATARNIGGVSFDGSANIDLAGVNTAGNQDTSGNAATATALETGRTISLTGDVTGTSGSFDGSGNASIAATIAANSVALGTDTTGSYVQQGATSGNGISGSVNSEAGTFTVASNATNANTGNTIVYRDASGNFSAGTITGTLSGNATNISQYTINQNVGTSNSPTFAGLNSTGNATFADNGKAIFGAGSDLQIYHDGSHSYIDDTSTGNLYLRSDGAGVIVESTAGVTMARFLNGNACDFNFGSTTRLTTTATGIDVTGTAEVDTLKFSDNSTQTSAGASTGKAIAMAIVFG